MQYNIAEINYLTGFLLLIILGVVLIILAIVKTRQILQFNLRREQINALEQALEKIQLESKISDLELKHERVRRERIANDVAESKAAKKS